MNIIKLIGWELITARILWKHIGNTLLTILGAKIIFYAALYGIDNPDSRDMVLWLEDYFALPGIVVWFIRETAVDFWNHRKRIRRKINAPPVWILGT